MEKIEKQIIRLHNSETNEIIDREMTEEEIAELETKKLENESLQTEAEAKATVKADLLAKLGITAEEAKLLLS